MTVTTKALTLKERIDSPAIRARFNEVLGKKAAGFVSSVISAVKANSQLSQIAPDSVISAAMVAATLDLPINPSLGFAHIVPYKGQAQFQMGWKGYSQLGLRSGQFSRMNASPVYEGQLILWDNITGDFKYDLSKKASEKVIGYVSYFRLTNGYEHYLYMTVEEIKAHAERYSQAYKRGIGPWFDTFEAMALKTVHKLNISKWAPMTQDMELALSYDQGVIKNPVTHLAGGEEVVMEYPDNGHNESETGPASASSEESGLSTESMSAGDPGTHQGHEPEKKPANGSEKPNPASMRGKKTGDLGF
ncbi:MAG: recombinase RecT [Candidatus Zixiibacteriota bacterium]